MSVARAMAREVYIQLSGGPIPQGLEPDEDDLDAIERWVEPRKAKPLGHGR